MVNSRWFALVDLLVVVASAAGCMIDPRLAGWMILIALIPWAIRAIAGKSPFQRTPLDWLIAIFLVSALVGLWAAYDKTAAWNKAWLILAAILLYYALAGQPRENLAWITGLIFCVGVGVSLHYFLAYDFVSAPRKLEFANRIGSWLVQVRPRTGWTSIHPNYVAGIVAITAPFILYPLWQWRKKHGGPVRFFRLLSAAGLCIVLLGLFLATSRGAVMAIAAGLGVFPLWRLAHWSVIERRLKAEAFFPLLMLIYLSSIVVVLYLGPASRGGIVPGNYYFGDGSRAELFSRSLYLLDDYPMTGGGLGAFPGLYSRYLLDIPYFNVPNSHNMYLDAAIEQGLFGGLAFLGIYLAGIWMAARRVMDAQGSKDFLAWIVLFSLIAAFSHGLVDDYLYNGNGTVLSLFLIAFAVLLSPSARQNHLRTFQWIRPSAGFITLGVAVLYIFTPGKILSAWYADLGAVRMSRVELDGFPSGGWAGPEIVDRLRPAEAALQTSLQLNPRNRTANQRLGMIAMLRQDFRSACPYLAAAHTESPDHRGIYKALGYCYIWLGDLSSARVLISQIPEAREELDVYIWWWGVQGRADLSETASLELQNIKNPLYQPCEKC